MSPTLSEDLEWRGSIAQVTDRAVFPLIDKGELTIYNGFDPSADSLQLGNLVPIVNLMRYQRAGNRIIVLAGGGTGMVGDPGGKSEERNLLTDDELERNLAGVRRQLERFLDFENAMLVDNGDWLWDVGYLAFLRDIGKHFTVNSMIARDSVRSRIESENGISYTEFSYMLLQAYDYLHLFDEFGCRLQLGGSDQWGNIVSGVDLIRRVRGEQAFAITFPLVTDEEGRKLGKTAGGKTVWLDRERTSPYEMYQYLFNVSDRLVGPYLRYLTFLERPEIEELDRSTADHPERREAQRALAYAVVGLVHGEDEAAKAKRASEVLFTAEIASLDEATLLDVVAEAPSSDRDRSELGSVALADVLAQTGVCSSKSDARRQLGQKGIYVNNVQVDADDRRLTDSDLLHGRYVVLRRGRKAQHLLRY